MKITDLIKVSPVRTMFGKRGKGFIAKFGEGDDITATGDTKESALLNLKIKITKEFEHRLTRRYLFTEKGTIFCLFHAEGWAYDIVHPDTETVSGCMFNAAMNYNEAFEKMKAHCENHSQ